jgi:hypothetical protein
MEFRCYELLHGGEGSRGECVEINGNRGGRVTVAELAAKYFDDCTETCVDNLGFFDGATQGIEVVGPDGKSTRHEVVCEVKRVYTAVVR